MLFKDFPPHISRLAYVYSSLIVQYIIPSIIVIIAYSSIYKVLKKSTAKIIDTRHKVNEKLPQAQRKLEIVFFVRCTGR